MPIRRVRLRPVLPRNHQRRTTRAHKGDIRTEPVFACAELYSPRARVMPRASGVPSIRTGRPSRWGCTQTSSTRCSGGPLPYTIQNYNNFLAEHVLWRTHVPVGRLYHRCQRRDIRVRGQKKLTVFSAVSTSAWYRSSMGTPSSDACAPYLIAKSPRIGMPSDPPWTYPLARAAI